MSRLTLTGSGSADVYAAESVPLGCSSRIRCRHLLKTFWIGAGGWADRQLSDGTVVWTAPSGQTYTTTPAGAEFFPQLGVPTGELLLPPTIEPPSAGRAAMMPTRKRARAQDKA